MPLLIFILEEILSRLLSLVFFLFSDFSFFSELLIKLNSLLLVLILTIVFSDITFSIGLKSLILLFSYKFCIPFLELTLVISLSLFSLSSFSFFCNCFSFLSHINCSFAMLGSPNIFLNSSMKGFESLYFFLIDSMKFS